MKQDNILSIFFYLAITLSVLGVIFFVYNNFASKLFSDIYSGLIFVLGWIIYLGVFLHFKVKEHHVKSVGDYFEKVAERHKQIFTVVNTVFNYILIAYLLLLLVQEFNYLNQFNLNYLLVATLFFGILTVLFPVKHEEKKEMKLWDKILAVALGIIGAVLIFIKTQDLGWLSYVISLISGILIVMIGFLIYEDDEKEEEEFYLTKKAGIISLIVLIVGSIVLSFFIGLEAFRIIFGSVYVLFMPGLVWTYVFFRNKEIDGLERIALSFALSIAIVPLMVFYLNLIGMKLNVLSVSLVILFIIVLGLIIIKKHALIKKKYDEIASKFKKRNK